MSLRVRLRGGPAPERLHRALEGDLETILAKALKRNPAERYPSVAAFADDLHRYLEHLPISARGDAFGYRTAKFVRRHYRVLAGTTVVVALVAALVVFYRPACRPNAIARGRRPPIVKGQRSADRPADQRRPLSDA